MNCPSLAALSSASGYFLKNLSKPRRPQHQFQPTKTTNTTKTPATANRMMGFFTVTIMKIPTSKPVTNRPSGTQNAIRETRIRNSMPSTERVTAPPYDCGFAAAAAAAPPAAESAWPLRRGPEEDEERGPEVMRPVGWRTEGLGRGPEPEAERAEPLLWEEEEGGFSPEVGMSNILPSSPDFFTSPPV